MFSVILMFLSVCHSSWAADNYGSPSKEQRVGSLPKQGLNRQINNILQGLDDELDYDEEITGPGTSIASRQTYYPSDAFYEEESSRRGIPIPSQQMHRSSGSFTGGTSPGYGVSPSLMALRQQTSRLEKDIRRDSDSDSGEDDEYERQMLQYGEEFQKEKALVNKGQLYAYIERELQQKGVHETTFRNYRVSVSDIISSIEINIADSVLKVVTDLQGKKDLKATEFEKWMIEVVKARRLGIDLLGQSESSEFIVNCKASIFKFYAKELFTNLQGKACESKAFTKFNQLLAQTGSMSSSQSTPALMLEPVSFPDLDQWLNFQLKTMIVWECFMNDLCSVKYGGINDIKLKLMDVAVPRLLDYLEINLIFLTTWYEDNRTCVTKALSAWGARTSQTKMKFDQFVEQFKSHFCSAKFSGQQITLAESEVQEIVDRYESKFSETDQSASQSISGVFSTATSWVAPSAWGFWGSGK